MRVRLRRGQPRHRADGRGPVPLWVVHWVATDGDSMSVVEETTKKARKPREPKPPKPKLPRPLWRILPGVAPCLSLRQPWAWAVVCADKIVENRQAWRGCAHRGPILVHAATGMTKGDYDQAVAFMVERRLARRAEHVGTAMNHLPIVPEMKQLARGGIVGIARVTGVIERGYAIRGERTPMLDDLTECERRWWMRGFGLLLSGNTQLASFVPCAGALGFFTPPVSVYDDVLRALQTNVPTGMVLRDRAMLRPSTTSINITRESGGLDSLYYVCDGLVGDGRLCGCGPLVGRGLSLEGGECDCLPNTRSGLVTTCRTCGTTMRAVDLKSGWPLQRVE